MGDQLVNKLSLIFVNLLEDGTTSISSDRLKSRDYHGIVARRNPIKSHNAKRGWIVLVFDVIMLQAYYNDICLLLHRNYYIKNQMRSFKLTL